MKVAKTEIKKIQLSPTLYLLHKTGLVQSDFGMDNSGELINGGFGLYSTAGLKTPLGPVKSEYYRIALTRAGNINVDCGLETFQPKRNSIVFGFPGQAFSIYNPSLSLFC